MRDHGCDRPGNGYALIVGTEPKHEKAQFAICKAAQMLKQLQTDYQAAWHGEIDLDGERSEP